MNKHKKHVYVIPEDDADRQIAVGFVDHHRVDDRRIQVMPVAGGWSHVLRTFRDEYIQNLRNFPKAHVVMLIDFDGDYDRRRKEFDNEIPDEIKHRVFVVGPRTTPETLKKAINNGSLREIGESLADDCAAGTTGHWDHDELTHNDPERRRLDNVLRPFIF